MIVKLILIFSIMLITIVESGSYSTMFLMGFICFCVLSEVEYQNEMDERTKNAKS